MKKASIDIGSNSTLLCIGEFEGDAFCETEGRSRVTGLGRNLSNTGQFTKEAMLETFNALSEYVDVCKKHHINPKEIYVTATEASRKALNAVDFFKDVKNRLSLEVKIISGCREAYYSTHGVLLGKEILPQGPFTIMDIGGASTEFIALDSSHSIKSSVSLPIGVVKISDMMKSSGADMTEKQVIDTLSGACDYHSTSIVCVAGTMTSLANMYLGNEDYIEKEVHGTVLNVEKASQVWDKVKNLSDSEILIRYPFLGKRSQTIKSGLMLFFNIAKTLKVDQFIVSTYGLRHGVLKQGWVDELE